MSGNTTQNVYLYFPSEIVMNKSKII